MKILDQTHNACKNTMNVKMNTKNTLKLMMKIKNLFLKNFQEKKNMQDTKLRNFQTSETNKLKMHMKNKKRHKTRKYEDQTRRLVKNNLKIMKNTMNAWNFEKCKKIFFKACN